MNLEEARAQCYDGSNLNAGIIYVKALEAEVERLQKECQRWTELRIQHNEQYHEAVVRANEAEIRAKKAEARVNKLEEEVVEARR